MRKATKTIGILLSSLCWIFTAWLVISYIEIICADLFNPVHSDWNLLCLFTKYFK